MKCLDLLCNSVLVFFSIFVCVLYALHCAAADDDNDDDDYAVAVAGFGRSLTIK